MFTTQGIVKPKRLEFDKKNKSDYYGKLSAGPFERGYGVTIGNSLRRMLLSSIEGAAIVAVKFEGIFHEFSSIPGVVEDVTEIILNLKQVNLQLSGEEAYKRIYIKASKPGTVCAKDITADPDIAVLNPDLPILTIDQAGEVEIEMIVRRGRGYVPADKHNIENESVQMIPMDSSFSPIEKITFHVENTRVGQSTDYDSLVMELWTNGGITPEDAVAHAAKIVKDHMQIFINFDEEPEPVQPQVDEKKQKVLGNMAKCVEELELSVRSYNCLKNANIQTIAELVQKTDGEMLRTRNFGRKSLNEIKEILEDMGLHLGMKVDEEDLKQISQAQKKKEIDTEVEL
ncbi:MAG: DNA-directed RNA polymerase subunit alpha [Nitrospina sp.]|jgi:DNA-directed RNA polymerase subunit alpha|nr:DNA-directed RNA polymerase subunit alpha [Nitrospina sp.]MBT3510968.1 DNA-directed RNA polymerase subunit alpha [Nitrospina sp.]MBT3874401.1 DNA-directed RNA polymerase subunit alpha [Nitrospina sp.]MBT4048828.1 DNA-directed RNA polymerase subunit alpha [Nitrospina sp.]MBT4558476.1 DNA-directed RNA polymerase subunit alpha [Nitrospina sp.]